MLAATVGPELRPWWQVMQVAALGSAARATPDGKVISEIAATPSVYPDIATSEVRQLLADDINNDCVSDLVVVQEDKTLVLVSEPSRGLRQSDEVLGGTNAAIADFDGDGLLDIMVADSTNGAFFLQQCPLGSPDC